ncbi:MAG: nucleotide exchange factor GrpE [Clostridiales bacterium]|nr:nucleotide exchange factor GrpE [Clostridiales bacterium]
MEEKKEFSCEAENDSKETAESAEANASAENVNSGVQSECDGDGAFAEDSSGDGTREKNDCDPKGEDSDTQTPTEETPGEESDAEAKDSKSEKGSFFRKKEKKDKKDEKIEELSDRVRRQMAEFDNFRKRTEKEKSQMFETGAKSIIEKILPVIDNFERGLAALTEEEKGSAFAEGMDKVYKQMMTVLEEAGVRAIETDGKEFDPNLHNAVMHIDDEAFGENIIAEEFQKGYMYRDSVVRHSMVKVAN